MKSDSVTLRALLIASLLSAVVSATAHAATARHAGVVVSVDQTAGAIVVGDVGPKLPSGESKTTNRTLRVTPATEVVRVKRSAGVAPSGWFRDYVETRLSALDVKPGDWVAVTAEVDKRGLTATRVVVVDTAEP